MPERPPWATIAADEGARTPKPLLPVKHHHRRTRPPSPLHRPWRPQQIQAMRQPLGMALAPIHPLGLARGTHTNAQPRRRRTTSRRSYRAPGPLRPILWEAEDTANGLVHRLPFPAPSGGTGPAHRRRTQDLTPRSTRVPVPPRRSRAQRPCHTDIPSLDIPPGALRTSAAERSSLGPSSRRCCPRPTGSAVPPTSHSPIRSSRP